MIKFTKGDCGEKISFEENKKQLLYMLNEIVSFCNANGLRYYLSGGTLLGAIRHKGFIPWDDDIDINIPRPDIEKLYRLTEGHLGSLVLVKPGDEMYSTNSQFYKLFNPAYIVEDTRGDAVKIHPIYYPINIDIFPIDGFPSDKKETKKFCRKLIFLRKMVGISWYKRVIGKNWKTYIAHALVFIPVKIVGYKRWCNIFQKYAMKYSFNDSKYIGVTTTVHYIACEKVEKKAYLKSIEVEFEGKKYCAPSSYDIYLKQLYRDYMKLPPKEKQNSGHTINIYRRKRNG